MEIRHTRGGFEVHGDTYLVRSTLKGMGGRWNGFAGAWTFDSEAEAQEAVAAATAELAVKQELAALEAT